MSDKGRIMVLVCDDKAMMRDAYSSAVESIEGISVKTVDHPEHVMDALRAHPKVSVLLMDLEFPASPGSKKKRLIGHKYLPAIRAEFPRVRVVVVTQMGPAVYSIVLECDRKGLHDEWIDVGKDFKPEEIMARIEPLIYPLGDISREGLWLLHLSDLHFGNSTPFAYWGLAEDGPLLDALKDDVTVKIPREFTEATTFPHLLAITGDIANHARDEEYEKAEVFIDSVVRLCLANGAMKSDDECGRVMIVPGNHDVNFDISRARCIDVHGDRNMTIRTGGKEPDLAPELRYLKKYMWAPFERFHSRLRVAAPSFDGLWNKDDSFAGARWSYPEFGFHAYGTNTSAEAMDHFTKVPGVNPDIIRSLQATETLSGSAPILPKILLAHHSFGSTTSGEDRANNDTIAALRKACAKHLGVRVFLTGHVHEDIAEPIGVDSKALLFIGAGSAAVADSNRPERESLHYNLLNMRPGSEADGSSDQLTIYSRVSFKDEFVANPKSPKLRYEWDDVSGWILREN